MKTLNLLSIESIDHIVTPTDFQDISLQSSALEIFTDFKAFNPLIIDDNTKAIDAQKLMEKAHVQLKIVISENNKFSGIVSSADISDQQLLKEVSKGAARDEILVIDLMRPRSSLQAFSYLELTNATVADVLYALKQNDLQHCLVVDHQAQQIRGVISSSDIARKLKILIAIYSTASFAEIYKLIQTQ